MLTRMPSGSGVRLMSRMVATAIAGADGCSPAGFATAGSEAAGTDGAGGGAARTEGAGATAGGATAAGGAVFGARSLLRPASCSPARPRNGLDGYPSRSMRQQPDRGPAVRSLLEAIEREQRDVRALPQRVVAVSALRVAAHDGFVERHHPPQLGKARAARPVAQFALTAERARIDRFRGFGSRRRRRAGHQRRQDGGQHDPHDVRDSAHGQPRRQRNCASTSSK